MAQTVQRDKSLDSLIATGLKWGAYAGFIILLAGYISSFFAPQRVFLRIDTIGVVVMMATPAFRVLIAFIVFLREKDLRYALITFGVLLILVLGAALGIGEHI